MAVEIKSLSMPYRNEDRTVRIYLPACYHAEPYRRYPVLYMMDGQNLFGSSNASISGDSWLVDEALNALEHSAQQGLIVVGIDHAVAERFDEYSPWSNEDVAWYPQFEGGIFGGGGKDFAEFIASGLKPWADEHYRTKPEAKYTCVAGSSMGGLISLYIAARYPSLFTKVGAFSTALWFCRRRMVEYLKQAAFTDEHRFFLQVGTMETSPTGIAMEQVYINCTKSVYQALREGGVAADRIKMIVADGAGHTERAWSKYFPDFLNAILPELA